MSQKRMSNKAINPIRAKVFQGTIQRNTFLDKIDVLIAEIETLRHNVRFSADFKKWERAVGALLCFAFGDESAQVHDFKNVSYSPIMFFSGMHDSELDHSFYEGLNDAEIVLKGIRDEVVDYFPESNQELKTIEEDDERFSSKDVFIVHGHNLELLLAVEKAIRTLGLNPIVLRDQPNEGMTLIQKFEKDACRARFAVFLLTADETATVHSTEEVEERARQNVVFELGYFFSAFKRKNGTHKGIFVILQNGVVKPGDVDGLVYQPYAGVCDYSWKLPLAKELKAAGLEIESEKVMEM